VDLTRSTLCILLPFGIVVAIFCSQGVIQNFNQYTDATTEGVKQIIPQGPVASQEAIKS
jgi:K+-transporting ATPase ATPase A chain